MWGMGITRRWYVRDQFDRVLLAIDLFGFAWLSLTAALGTFVFLHFAGVGWARTAAVVAALGFVLLGAGAALAMAIADRSRR